MGSLLQLLNEWEIQVLMLISFILQVFLFFTGNLRQCSTNMLLRGTIWIAYLGADLVAIYALGFLSRQEEATNERGILRGTHSLAFLWAPFVLIHLGGQDTITAFSMEDNSLWLRHLLNLLVQVGIALFVFWKSTSWRNVHLLVPGIFLFVAGIIKYGERTLALMHGNISNTWVSIDEEKKRVRPRSSRNNSYSGIVCFALRSMPGIRYLFTGSSMLQTVERIEELLRTDGHVDESDLPKLLDVELGIMYYDLYTKAALLRTRGGIILRCISQVSFMVALVLFAISDKQQYQGTADIAITYILFIGGFLLEVCATLVIFMVSPWTWAWLEAREYRRLARMSWFLLCSDIIGWPEGKPLWSNRIGQYSLLSYMGCEKPSSLSQRAMSMIRKVAKAVGVERRKLFWLSKSLDTKYEEVDKEMFTECIVKGILRYGIERSSSGQQQWQHFGVFLNSVPTDFGALVMWFHVLTEAHLSEVSAASCPPETVALVDVCRKLSNYMLYLLLALPGSKLQVSCSKPDAYLDDLIVAQRQIGEVQRDNGENFLRTALRLYIHQFEFTLPEPCKETLEEMRDIRIRLLIYAAGKSRAEMHAAQLSRGGELLTFAWLLLVHNQLGDSGYHSIERLPSCSRQLHNCMISTVDSTPRSFLGM